MHLTEDNRVNFQKTIWDYFNQHGRTFAWRNTTNPYFILVSEIMLQQTQTSRVVHKYQEFITAFPTIELLAQATLRDVLIVWQGLGYNRRGMNLYKTAQIIVHEYNGIIPKDPTILQTFPGIGPNTAGSIAAFAYNVSTSFIETNIRAVYIHFFFNDQDKVHDKQLLPLIEQTKSNDKPRLWYYALMDYGVMLKKNHKNPSRKSAHHVRQTPFEGSNRQIRSSIIKLLTFHPAMNHNEIIDSVNEQNSQRTEKMLDALVQDGLVTMHNNMYSISS